MNFTLIVCTYHRPGALKQLLDSVEEQTLYPDQILIIDGSTDEKTCETLKQRSYRNLEYYKVNEQDRGLTKQRNYGVNKVSPLSKIICFLDDDIVLTPSYFEHLLDTYKKFPDALGAGGYIVDEVEWKKLKNGEVIQSNDFVIDGYSRPDSSRFLLRKKVGLLADTFPTYMPTGGHGRSVGFLPPSGKIYPVETFMGGVSSYKRKVFEQISFSPFFEGYGLYEDTDFTLRLSKLGKLYLNTAARLFHYHNEDGRPNQFKYGKMVVRNGYYVWRVKYPAPSFLPRIQWHLTTGILILIRFSNVINTKHRKQALTESLGRLFGWVSLIFNKPK